jgi:hypothetical protein
VSVLDHTAPNSLLHSQLEMEAGVEIGQAGQPAEQLGDYRDLFLLERLIRKRNGKTTEEAAVLLGAYPREDSAVHGRSERGRGDTRRVAGEDRRVYCRTGGGGRTKSRY